MFKGKLKDIKIMHNGYRYRVKLNYAYNFLGYIKNVWVYWESSVFGDSKEIIEFATYEETLNAIREQLESEHRKYAHFSEVKESPRKNCTSLICTNQYKVMQEVF